jgi:hypothetical protein
MKTFTFPGRMGDLLMQWPVAYQWHKKTGEQFRVVTCEHWNMPRMLPLLETQKCVAEVTVMSGIINDDSCGGQPWHFNLKEDPDYFHMGYQDRPNMQLTDFTLKYFPEPLDRDAVLNEASLDMGERNPQNYCVFFAKPHQNWETALELMQKVTDRFDKVYVIGLPEDLSYICQNVPDTCWQKWHNVDSKTPDLLSDARLIRDARVVITINSLVPTISNVLKVPTVVVHRAQPFQTYSNTGPNQFNFFPAHRHDFAPALEFLDNV